MQNWPSAILFVFAINGMACYCNEYKITFILSKIFKIARKAYNKNNSSCFEGNTLITGPRARGRTFYPHVLGASNQRIALKTWSIIITLHVFIYIKGSLTKEQAKLLHIHDPGVLQSFGLRMVPITAVHEFATYHKIMLVRHPFTRLVSAYNDKFTVQNAEKDYFQQYIIRTYLNKRQKPRRYRDWRVAFDEFIDAVVHGYMDEHWEPFQDRCNMCNIDYDSVLRLETLSRDIPNVLDILGLNISILDSFSKNRRRSDNSRISNKRDTGDAIHTDVLNAFNTISSSNIQALRRIYANDLNNLGYEFDSNSKVTSCRINTGADVCC